MTTRGNELLKRGGSLWYGRYYRRTVYSLYLVDPREILTITVALGPNRKWEQHDYCPINWWNLHLEKIKRACFIVIKLTPGPEYLNSLTFDLRWVCVQLYKGESMAYMATRL